MAAAVTIGETPSQIARENGRQEGDPDGQTAKRIAQTQALIDVDGNHQQRQRHAQVGEKQRYGENDQMPRGRDAGGSLRSEHGKILAGPETSDERHG